MDSVPLSVTFITLNGAVPGGNNPDLGYEMNVMTSSGTNVLQLTEHLEVGRRVRRVRLGPEERHVRARRSAARRIRDASAAGAGRSAGDRDHAPRRRSPDTGAPTAVEGNSIARPHTGSIAGGSPTVTSSPAVRPARRGPGPPGDQMTKSAS